MNLARDLAFRTADVDAAHHLVRRLNLLHADRCAQATAGDQQAAVRDATLIHDAVEGATVQQLRAALILATTPELRSLPVVLGRPAPAPAVGDVMRVVLAYGGIRADYARRILTADAVQTALDGVRIAVEALAAGTLVREIIAEHRAGGL